MKYYGVSLIERCAEFIILFASVTVIAFMITGGCGGGGGHGGQQTPGPTGPPPGCEDIKIDPECPAVSLAGLCRFWGGYHCHFTEINTENPEPETIDLGIQLADCTIPDCFTLECEEIFSPMTEMLNVTLNIMEIGNEGGIIPETFSGTAEIEGVEFDYICNPPPIP